MLLNKTQKIYCHVVLLQTSFKSLFCSNFVFWEDFLIHHMGPASSFPDCPISHPRCVWWCPDTIWVLLRMFWACTDPLQAQNMHNTDPKKGFSFFFFPPLLGMLKNHQKATDIENFDENSFFFPHQKSHKISPI